jgi:hypothetical protein
MQLASKHHMGEKVYQVARGLTLFKHLSQNILFLQLKLPLLRRINQQQSTLF